jgi:hypothetical protein
MKGLKMAKKIATIVGILSLAIALTFNIIQLVNSKNKDTKALNQKTSDLEHSAIQTSINNEIESRMRIDNDLIEKVDSIKTDTDQMKGTLSVLLDLMKKNLLSKAN